MASRVPHKDEIVGSIPTLATIRKTNNKCKSICSCISESFLYIENSTIVERLVQAQFIWGAKAPMLFILIIILLCRYLIELEEVEEQQML